MVLISIELALEPLVGGTHYLRQMVNAASALEQFTFPKLSLTLSSVSCKGRRNRWWAAHWLPRPGFEPKPARRAEDYTSYAYEFASLHTPKTSIIVTFPSYLVYSFPFTCLQFPLIMFSVPSFQFPIFHVYIVLYWLHTSFHLAVRFRFLLVYSNFYWF